MSNLPEDLTINNILPRLPIKSLVRYRCVSNFLNYLTYDRGFIDTHLNLASHRNPNLILIGTTCKGATDYRNQIYFLEIDENHPHTCIEINVPIPSFHEFRVMGSCNGLLCLVHPRNRYNIAIFNPCIGQFMKLPEPISMVDQPGDMVVGFGWSQRTDEYKVLVIVGFPGPVGTAMVRSLVFVYTIGGRSWRLKETTHIPELGQSASKAFVNGALHWVSTCSSKLIVSFDIDSEEFGIVPQPDFDHLEQGSYTLGVFGLCLCIFKNSFDECIDTWVMKEYGVANAWVHMFTMCSSHIGRNIMFVQVVCFLEDGEVLMLYDSRALLSYNSKTMVLREIDIHKIPPWFEAVSHVGSLVSPLRRISEH